jgi:hypothetical protein
MPIFRGGLFAALLLLPSIAIGADIVLKAKPGLQKMPAAVESFRRAATAWEALITDPIVVTIEADMAPLGPVRLATTDPLLLSRSYADIRDALVCDATNDESDGAIVAHLPTAGKFAALLPKGFVLSGRLASTKANLKALNFDGRFGDLDNRFGKIDAIIIFNFDASFDFDNRDGIEVGRVDFESVVLHEIGHALGFVSVVGAIDKDLSDLHREFEAGDSKAIEVSPRILDLFRFSSDAKYNPSSYADFTAMPRSLLPGKAAVFDQINRFSGSEAEIPFSTGVIHGDGFNADHWKSQLRLGNQSPFIQSDDANRITPNDLRAFDLIGYDVCWGRAQEE